MIGGYPGGMTPSRARHSCIGYHQVLDESRTGFYLRPCPAATTNHPWEGADHEQSID
jgi:hypothetical protein